MGRLVWRPSFLIRRPPPSNHEALSNVGSHSLPHPSPPLKIEGSSHAQVGFEIGRSNEGSSNAGSHSPPHPSPPSEIRHSS